MGGWATLGSKPPHRSRMLELNSLDRNSLGRDSLGHRMLPTPAWLVSLCLHVALFLFLAVGLRTFRGGTGGNEPRVVGIAFVQEVGEGETNQAPQSGVSQDSGGPSSNQAMILSASAVAQQGAPVDIQSLLSDLVGGSGGGATAAMVGSEGNSVGPGGGGARGGKKNGLSEVNFYGVSGAGNSFVYVIDRSESMKDFDGAPIRAAKRELIQSLTKLEPVHQFQVIFYSNTPFPFRSKYSGARGLIRARDIERELAAEFVDAVTAEGGTEHLPALRMGISMGPDVLFFLTDADEPRLTSREVQGLVDQCGGHTTIHSVEYGKGPNPAQGRWIETLAKMTGGSYRYVDLSQLEN